jgi:hypothetical protein
VAQAVGNLLCKCKALSSNLILAKKKKKKAEKLGMVVHTCIPSCEGGRDRKIELQCQPEEKAQDSLCKITKQNGLEAQAQGPEIKPKY